MDISTVARAMKAATAAFATVSSMGVTEDNIDKAQALYDAVIHNVALNDVDPILAILVLTDAIAGIAEAIEEVSGLILKKGDSNLS